MLCNVFFNGQKGRLHAKYYDSQKRNGQYVLLLPDFKPGNKNTFNDEELFRLFKIFVELEFSVLILNYRGLGRSQGELKEEKDAVIDASSACDWIQENAKDLQSFYAVGISYGAIIANDISRRRPEITDVLIYKPNFNIKSSFDFSDCSIINTLLCVEEEQRKKFEQVIEKSKDQSMLEKMTIFFFDKDNKEKIYNDINSHILESLAVKISKKITKRRRRRAGKVIIMKKKTST